MIYKIKNKPNSIPNPVHLVNPVYSLLRVACMFFLLSNRSILDTSLSW